jgi:hypothetical protein
MYNFHKIHLSWSSILHRRRENGKNSGLWVKNSLLKNSLMLLNADRKGYIIIFGPTSKWMEEKDWLLEAFLFQQTSPGVLHYRKCK